MRLTWPLSGRSGESRLIEAAVVDSASNGIVIRGPAGVGKSRILRETLTSLGAEGWRVRWVVGTSSARSLPLGALTTWARSSGNDSLQLVHAVIAALTASPEGDPVVVGVDDAPLLDDLSTVVIHQVIQRGLAKVVLTVRDGEPVPAATQELWKVGEFDSLDVRPLPRSVATALVTEALGGPLDLDAADRLWALTRGNPLYLRNIVEQEVADQRLRLDRGMWRWTGEPVVPPGLVELVEARIGGLPDPVSDVVDVLAVGEPIELGSLARIADAAAVEEADRRGLISFEPADGVIEVRLAHPLYGEVRRSRAPHTTLRRLRGLVASELGSSDHPNDIHLAVRRGSLSLDSDLAPDVDVLLNAARGAAWMLNLTLADRLAEAAIAAGGGVKAGVIRAFVLSWLGRGTEAETVLAQVDPAALADRDRARLTFLRAVNLFFTLADPPRAKSLVDAAIQQGSPLTTMSANAFRCVYWAAMGDPAAALDCAATFSIEELPDNFQARLTAWAITVASGESGRTAAAVATAEAGYPIPVRAFIVIADAHINALLCAGRIDDAEKVASMMRERAVASQGAPFGQIAIAVTGLTALGAGHLDEACLNLTTATERETAWNADTGFRYRYQTLLTTALAMRGFSEAADAAQVKLDKVFHPAWRYLDYARSIAEAWVAASHGAVSQAIAVAWEAAERACDNGQFAAEVMCLQTATQFGDTANARRLRELSLIVEGPRAGTAADFAEALAASDAPGLDAVSRRFEDLGDLVAALDAAAHAAVCFRKKGLRGSALRCSARAEELAERSGDARTPALLHAVERLPLTDREREIVTLLAEPMSNRDIAARLRLSVRTVESHVYNAMAKTGTTCRDELAALVRTRARHTPKISSDVLKVPAAPAATIPP